MDRLRLDLRFAVRSLIRSPLVTGAAIASLALGIGANAAIFSAIDAFQIRPLRFDEPHDLVFVWTTHPDRGWTQASSSVPDFRDWRAQSRTLDLAAYQSAGVDLVAGGEPERLTALRVSPGFLEILRKPPALGRAFAVDEEAAGAPRVVVLGDGLWRRRFGADPAIVGRIIELDDEPWEVIGVAQPDIRFGRDPDVWLPLRISGEEPRNSRYLAVLGRVRPGHVLEDARAEMATLQSRIAAADPAASGGTGTNVVTLREQWFDEGFRQGSMIAGVAVLFVLLIACSNVANLLLARGAARGREVALRTAIGAGRGSILRQLMTESLLLASVGGLAALPLAILGVRGIRGLFPPELPGIDALTLDLRVLAFMAAITLLAGTLVGIVPAVRQSRGDLRRLIADGGRGTTDTRGGRLRAGLVVAEIALAAVLLVSSVLLVQAFVTLRGADLGFGVDERVTFGVALPASRYAEPAAVHAFQRTLAERLEGLPGARAVALASMLPMSGSSGRYYVIPDEPPPEPGREPVTEARYVSPGYFDALGIRIEAGRAFGAADDADAARSVIISRGLAARHWPDANPIGRRIRFAGEDHEIVGLASDIREGGPDDEPWPVAYLPLLQSTVRTFDVAVHTPAAASVVADATRRIVRDIDPRQPVYELSSLRASLEGELAGSLAMTKVLGALAVIAFVLSAVGVYGVMAYGVAQRRQEVGIRMALGARPRDVLALILRRGALITGLGIAIGLVAAVGVTRLLAFFLFGVSPFHAVAFVSVPAALAATGFLASLLPALRAAGVDPLVSLRAE